jgi:hypothetical protein
MAARLFAALHIPGIFLLEAIMRLEGLRVTSVVKILSTGLVVGVKVPFTLEFEI